MKARGKDPLEFSLGIITRFLCCRYTNSSPLNVDAIFVFGHTDARIAQHAGELFKKGSASHVVVTGKGRKEIEGFSSEAAFYTDILLNMGVPREAMIVEHRSMNTLKNVVYGIQRYVSEVGKPPLSVVLVAFPFLLRRAKLTMQQQWPKIRVRCSAPFDVTGELDCRRIWRMLAEFDRIEEYSKKGDIAPAQIPESVRRAETIVRKHFAHPQIRTLP